MKFIILGCGSSMGVPRPDGYFGNCDPKNKKNYRTRCSALIKTDLENVLIDTSPDLRLQMLSQNIKKIDKVFYSHMHADQTHGVNDLRSFFISNKKPINVFADSITSKYLKKIECFCFEEQTFKPGEVVKLPLYFAIDEKLPNRIKTVTLSYSFFESINVSKKN